MEERTSADLCRDKKRRKIKKATDGGRAWSVNDVKNATFEGIPLTGKWREAIGTPELAHSWIIWGQSSSGKTTFNMQLLKELSQFESVIYNSMEEGLSSSIQTAFNRAQLKASDNVQLVQESMGELTTRLKKKNSANVVFIDSVPYTRMRLSQYFSFCEQFPGKLLIWVAHAKGKEPKGALADDIRYDAFVKIYVEGFRAFIRSRFTSGGGDTAMDIYKEGARKYWAELAN